MRKIRNLIEKKAQPLSFLKWVGGKRRVLPEFLALQPAKASLTKAAGLIDASRVVQNQVEPLKASVAIHLKSNLGTLLWAAKGGQSATVEHLLKVYKLLPRARGTAEENPSISK